MTAHPIATPEQHAHEREALELARHPIVRAARESVRERWLAAADRGPEMRRCFDDAFEEVMFSAAVWSLNQDPLRPRFVCITRLAHSLGGGGPRARGGASTTRTRSTGSSRSPAPSATGSTAGSASARARPASTRIPSQPDGSSSTWRHSSHGNTPSESSATPIPDNLEARVRELYVANQERWTEPPRIGLQHILVDLYGRTREMALERAREARAKALAGQDFLELAAAYSNDPGLKMNKGVLGFPAAKELDPSVAEAAFALKADGEISEVVESRFGFHVLKRTGYRPGYVRKFDDVKESIQIIRTYGFIFGKNAIDHLRQNNKTNIRWKFRIHHKGAGR